MERFIFYRIVLNVLEGVFKGNIENYIFVDNRRGKWVSSLIRGKNRELVDIF